MIRAASARRIHFEGTNMPSTTLKFASRLVPLVSAALVGPLFTGCATRDATLPNDVTTALASAFTRGDVEACVALYSKDAEILSDDAPAVRGKEAITEFFKGQVAREILFATDPVISVVREDLAMDQGTYRVRNVQRGVDVEYGEYLNVWRLEDGKWRVFRTMYNVTMSPRAAVSITRDDDLPI
jgi:ketosteroid isomerase-like protein